MVPPIVWTLLSIANYVVVILLIEHIVRTRREPRGALVWILTLILLPILGLILYALVGRAPIMRKVRRRRRRLRKIEPALARQTAVLAREYDAREKKTIHTHQRDLIHVATRVSDTVVTRGNKVAIYHDAERAFLALGLAIEEAQSHVHMEYYIFAEDETGCAMRDLLGKKARQGVEVRLLLDAVGCWSLDQSFVDSLREQGVHVAFFLPWGIMHRRFQLNCRNHRKLTIIDGKLGFSGSKNIADEYLGRKKKYGPWLDTHLEVRGPCAAQLQEVFVEDWHFATKENLSADKYFPTPVVAGEGRLFFSGGYNAGSLMLELKERDGKIAAETVFRLTPQVFGSEQRRRSSTRTTFTACGRTGSWSA